MADEVPRSLKLALFFSVATYSTLQSIVVPVIPEITRHFGSSPLEAAWLVSGFLVTGSVIPPIAGRIGDLIGPRRTLMALLAVFLVGIVLALCATSMFALILARMVQGLGAAFISLGLSIARDAYPPERLGGAMGMVATTSAVASGTGLALSGPLTAVWGFHSVFLLPLVVAVLAIVLLSRQVRDDPPGRRGGLREINWWGGALFVSGMSSGLLSITFGGMWGWAAPATLASLALSLVLLAAWAVVELRARVPLIDVRLFRSAGIRRTGYATLLIGGIAFSSYNFLPIVLADDRLDFHVPQAAAGLLMLPISLGSFAAGLLAARLMPRLGMKGMLLLSTGINVAAMTAGLAADGRLWLLAGLSFAHGAAVTLAYSSLPALIMSAAPDGASGVAAGIYNTLRAVGGAIGSQIMFGIVAAGVGAPGTGVFVQSLLFLAGMSALMLLVGLSVPRPR